MHKPFKPDLIIEATSVCDRACIGCYAPNVVSKESSTKLLKSNPSLFLQPERLALTIGHLSLAEKIVSIRGGEPTRHPLLSELLKILAKTGAQLYLETHGKWLVDEENSQSLLRVLAATETNVKISFDSMHGTSPKELSEMIAILRANKVGYSLAITEASSKLFLKSLALIEPQTTNEIYLQTKAITAEALIRPSLGVICVDGFIKKSLNSKLESSDYELERKSVAV